MIRTKPFHPSYSAAPPEFYCAQPRERPVKQLLACTGGSAVSSDVLATMDGENTKELHPFEVLRKVASIIDLGYDQLSVRLPERTTLKTALEATTKSLESVDEEVVFMPPRAYSRRYVREVALQTVRDLNEGSLSLTPGDRGLDIRTSVDLTSVSPPEPASEQVRENLREIAKRDAKEPFRQPYVTLQAESTEQFLPLVTGNLSLRALDGQENDPECRLDSVKMIWDTGAHRTIMTEELLPVKFREFLKNPIHDPYRSSNGRLGIQIDAIVAFTNRAKSFTAPVLIVPKKHMPNQLVGVLLGQCMCINRLVFRSVPRQIIKRKGGNIPDDRWGDIIVTEYLTEKDDIVAL